MLFISYYFNYLECTIFPSYCLALSLITATIDPRKEIDSLYLFHCYWYFDLLFDLIGTEAHNVVLYLYLSVIIFHWVNTTLAEREQLVRPFRSPGKT